MKVIIYKVLGEDEYIFQSEYQRVEESALNTGLVSVL